MPPPPPPPPAHAPDPRAITDRDFGLAEGPLWDPDRAALFFTDIDAGHIHVIRSEGADPEQVYDGPRVGGMTLQHDGKLLLFREDDVATLVPETGDVRTVVDLGLDGVDRCNDVLALPSGAVLFGTIGVDDASGGVHLLDQVGRVTTLFRGTRIPNGMALSPTMGALYYSDSTAGTVSKFPFDQRENILGNRETLHRANGDTPDGLACDDLGFLYSARWGGSRVLKLDYTGREFTSIRLPVENVTSVTIAGADGRTLFITTAGGPVFSCPGQSAGVPDHRSGVIPEDS